MARVARTGTAPLPTGDGGGMAVRDSGAAAKDDKAEEAMAAAAVGGGGGGQLGIRAASTGGPVAGIPKAARKLVVRSRSGGIAIPEQGIAGVPLSESEDSGEKARDSGGYRRAGGYVAHAEEVASACGGSGSGHDGVRRQGRSSKNRGGAAALPALAGGRAKQGGGGGAGAAEAFHNNEGGLLPLLEKPSATKQMRSARAGTDKGDRGKVHAGPVLSLARSAFPRLRRAHMSSFADVSGESDDDQDEVGAAVQKAVEHSGLACGDSPFWREVEPYFEFVTPKHIEFIHKIGQDISESDSILQIPKLGENPSQTLSIADGQAWLAEDPAQEEEELPSLRRQTSRSQLERLSQGHSSKSLSPRGPSAAAPPKSSLAQARQQDVHVPLQQRLLAALIDSVGPDVEQQCTAKAQGDWHKWRYGDGADTGHDRREELSKADDIVVAGDAEPGATMAKVEEAAPGRPGGSAVEREEVSTSGEGLGGGGDLDGGPQSAWERRYRAMTLDERIRLELQSIGLLPEEGTNMSQREDDEVCLHLRRLQQELRDQVHANKERVMVLEQAMKSKREEEERERERLSLYKLVEIAYEKRLGRRGGNGNGSGSAVAGSAKGARHAAAQLAWRALARLRDFEEGRFMLPEGSALRQALMCQLQVGDLDNGAVGRGAGGGGVPAQLAHPLKQPSQQLTTADDRPTSSTAAGAAAGTAPAPGGRRRSASHEQLDGLTASGAALGSPQGGGPRGKRSAPAFPPASAAKGMRSSLKNKSKSKSKSKRQRPRLLSPHSMSIDGSLLAADLEGQLGKGAGGAGARASGSRADNGGGSGGGGGRGTAVAESSTGSGGGVGQLVDLFLGQRDDVMPPPPGLGELGPPAGGMEMGGGLGDLAAQMPLGMDELGGNDLGMADGQDDLWGGLDDPSLQDGADMGDFAGLSVPMDDLSMLGMMM
eukprot:SM000100S09431  [mRNA]  locus=s100:333488:338907:- [translate_table: standard]